MTDDANRRPTPGDEEVAHITRLVMPGQTNRHGSLFGGVAMSLMDEAAGVVATRRARGPVVTAHIASIDFKAPIWQNEAVHVIARLAHVGTTSMRLNIQTLGENLETGQCRMCTEATFVMVAIDQAGRPRPVPRASRDEDANDD